MQSDCTRRSVAKIVSPMKSFLGFAPYGHANFNTELANDIIGYVLAFRSNELNVIHEFSQLKG